MRRWTPIGLLLVFLLLAAGFLWKTAYQPQSTSFNALRAYQDVQYQVGLGPRTPGSSAHAQTIAWITSQLSQAGWMVETGDAQVQGKTAHNIVARRGNGPIILLGAHYDSRLLADQDPSPDLRQQPVPGANDGASGVAVLVELGRSLPKTNKELVLVFFDLEDQGGIDGLNYIEGSNAYASQMTDRPEAVVIIDMIGDADQNIYFEESSTSTLKKQIWQIAANLGYQKSFIQQNKYNMIDDHSPFLAKGLAAVDIIDFDYPAWHTSADTADKVSPASLMAVGDTLWHWIQQ